MEYFQLAPDLQISRVVTGLWQIADIERKQGVLDPIQTAEQMQPYVDAGYTTFDMADHYGSAEVIAGTFRRNATDSDKTQLFTKWVPTPGRLPRAEVEAAVDQAKRRLQTDTLDLLQYHAWNYADASYLDQLMLLQELRGAGHLAHLGVTNFDAAHLRILATSGIHVVSNQVCYSIIDQRAQGKMTEVCREFGIHLLAFGTLAGGFLTEKWLDREEPSMDQIDQWSLMKYKRFIDAAGGWQVFQKVLGGLKKIAEANRVSIANIACKYVLDQPMVAAIIVGARLGENNHLQSNQKLFDFDLKPGDREKLAEIAGLFQKIPGDCGDEYRRPPFLTASGDLSHHLDRLPPPFPATTGINGQRVLSGTSWEQEFGYCRAIRKGNRISVSGTTASHGDRLIGGADAAAQTHFVIDKIEGALQSLGGRLDQVTRTRTYVPYERDWPAVARAHGARFGNIQPANTLVRAALVGDEFLVEMEAEADCT